MHNRYNLFPPNERLIKGPNSATSARQELFIGCVPPTSSRLFAMYTGGNRLNHFYGTLQQISPTAAKKIAFPAVFTRRNGALVYLTVTSRLIGFHSNLYELARRNCRKRTSLCIWMPLIHGPSKMKGQKNCSR